MLKVVSSSKLAFVLLLNQTAFPALPVSSATLSVPLHEMDAHADACVCARQMVEGKGPGDRYRAGVAQRQETGLQLNGSGEGWGGFKVNTRKAVQQKMRCHF